MKFYIVVLSVAALAVSVSSRAVSGRDANPDLISRFDDTIKRDDIIGAVGKRSLIPKDTDCTGCTF